MTIDWTDKRAIGLKYKFLNNGKVFNVESVKVYKGILYIDNIGAGRVGTNDWTKTIQLVQGDKTPYDGKSQPVPDGVDITLFFIHKLPETRKAETVDWEDGTFKYYQVQEMPEEKQAVEEPFKREERYVVLKLKNMTKIKQDFLYNIILDLEGAYGFAEFQTKCVVVESDWKCYEQTWQAIQRELEGKDLAVPIKQSTIDTAIKLLEDSKSNYSDIKALIESNGDDASQCLVEMATIESIIKELKGE